MFIISNAFLYLFKIYIIKINLKITLQSKMH